MIVARQFIAWSVPHKEPSRRERYDSVDRTFFDHGRRICGVAQLTPSLRDGSPFLGAFQAIDCLATIIRSLRDKVRCVPQRQQTSLTTVHKIEATPLRPFEDDDEDE